MDSSALAERPPLRLLNESFAPVDQGRSFTIFPKLPAELRLLIWRTYLRHHRIVRIVVRHPEVQGDAPADGAVPEAVRLEPDDSRFYCETNALGNVVSGKSYYLFINGQHRPSVLLRVNAEARAAALGFYRLHLPYSSPPPPHGGKCLYLNPEFDFVQVQLDVGTAGGYGRPSRPAPPLELFAEFFYDCKAYDPSGRGILNLMVGNGMVEQFRLPKDPRRVPPQALAAFRSTLANVKALFFCIQTQYARKMTGDLSIERIRYNRSVPIQSLREDIVFLGSDPRRIEHDLHLVSVGIDPRASLWAWREMETRFGVAVSTAGTADVRFLLTNIVQPDDDVKMSTVSGTKEYLLDDEGRWQRLFNKKTGFLRTMDNPDTPVQIRDSVHAVGFWLLDLDAFGVMPTGAGPFEFNMRHRWDISFDAVLTDHRPELGLFVLDR